MLLNSKRRQTLALQRLFYGRDSLHARYCKPNVGARGLQRRQDACTHPVLVPALGVVVAALGSASPLAVRLLMFARLQEDHSALLLTGKDLGRRILNFYTSMDMLGAANLEVGQPPSRPMCMSFRFDF